MKNQRRREKIRSFICEMTVAQGLEVMKKIKQGEKT